MGNKKRKHYQNHGHAQQEQQRREEMFEKVDQQKLAKKKKNTFWLFSIIIVVLLIIGGWTFSHYVLPGPYDDFAKCLTQKGAVMYGAIEWCTYTQGQAGMFGKSFKYVDYRDESELDGIRTRPTWVIDGKRYEKVQSFQTLAAVTGCKI